MNGNPEDWPKIDLDDEYAAGRAYMRLRHLSLRDPYVSLFTKETVEALCNLIYTDDVLGSESIKHKTLPEIFDAVHAALDMSPLGLLMSEQFRNHFITLVGRATLSGKD